jgi:hypothetical protein
MGASPFTSQDVPRAVRDWLEAHVTHDVERELSSLCEDVVVAAGGRLFLGRAAACEWSRHEPGTGTALVGVRCSTRGDATVVTLLCPGAVEVTYCFLLSGDLIRGLAVAA